MSLIIAFNVRDGIAVGADKCTTHHENGRTSHSMDSKKIVIYDNRCVALHCGDYFVADNYTAQEFLESCKDIFTNDSNIVNVPLAILNRFNQKGFKSDNTFFICGFDDNGEGAIYKINTKDQTVTKQSANRVFAGTWDGIYNVATPMLKSAQCERMSLMDAAILEKLAIEATGLSQLHCGVEITVGCKADVYMLSKDGKNDCWLCGGPTLHIIGGT